MAGRYLLQRRLGRGGAKDVWLAHDLTLDRPVALARMSGPGAWERMRREARLTARLGGHRHIVTVHDVFADDDTPVLVARYMTGGSLADRGGLSVPEVIRAGREIADALAHAHAHAVVHRDVKPDNVWLAADGEAALGDFGVALADGEEAVSAAGTPLYAAPEQARGETVTERSDLYALGATLYELLCGRAPLATARLTAPVPPSQLVGGVPAALDGLLLSLLARDPADRPGSAAEVRAALDALLPHGGAVPISPEADRLVGREAELDAARAALARAWEGALGTLLVSGEPGIGKTALVDALAAEARERGGATLRGRGEPEGGPYAVWRPVVRALVGAEELRRVLGAAAEEPEAQLALFDAVSDALDTAAAQRPLLIVLDDLHWADASSLRALAHIAAAGSPARVLIVGTARAGELPALRDAGHIDLSGLSLDGVRRLLPPGTDAQVVRTIHVRTAGNPFYVGELARLLDGGRLPDAVPARVREAVRARVAALGAETAPVLEVGAVVGRFSIAGLAAASGRPRADVAAHLQPALAAGLVEPEEPGRFAFAHAIVRDAVYDDLPPARRAALHEAVTRALRDRRDAGADVEAAELAHHALAAARGGGDPQVAWACAVEAAREAEAALGHAEAAGRYADALEALELGAEAPADERLGVLLALAEATYAAGDIEAGRARFQQAAAAARRAGAPEVLARAAVGFAGLQQYGVLDTEAVELLTGALEALPDEPGELRARVTGLLAARLRPATDQERREALIVEAVAMAPDDRTLLALQSLSVMIHWRPESVAVRRAAADDVLRLAGQAADHAALVFAHVQRIRDALQEGDPEAAGAGLDRTRPIARASRRSYQRWFLLVVEAAWATFQGRLAEGDRLAEEALALNRRHGEDCEQEHTVQRLVLARVRWRPQDADVARLREYASRYAALPVWEAMVASLEWELGHVDAARAGLETCARDGFAAVRRSVDGLAALALLGEVAAGTGDRVDELYEILLPHAARNPVIDDAVAALGPVARVLGLLAAAADRPADAAEHFGAAIALAGRWGAPAWELRAVGDWLWTGVPGDRGALLDRGLGLARELELPWVAASLGDAAQITTP